MKKLLFALLSAVCLGVSADESEYTGVTDVYKFSMSLKVPRIYNNNCSLGYRKYQGQNITGYLKIKYPNVAAGESGQPEITITGLENKTHKINGKNITYKVTVGYDGPMTRVNLIGDNKKDEFKTPSVCFYIDAEPSYNVGEDDEDNSLLCTLAGSGSMKTVAGYTYSSVCSYCSSSITELKKSGKCRIIGSMSGNVAGTLGCGCRVYGHVSPTRVASSCGASDDVDDVAAVYGTWKATYYYSVGVKECNGNCE